MAKLHIVRGPGTRGRLAALCRGRCPRCRAGRIFQGRLTMHPRCPVCRLDFEPEPGYFTGAMYISYALAVPIVAGLTVLVYRVAPDLPPLWAVLLAGALFVPVVPAVFRASRVLWIHLDRTIDPG